MKIFRIIIGLFAVLAGLAICVFAFLFFFGEEEAMLIYASLLVSLMIGIIVLTAGITCFELGIKKDNDKEGNK